MQGTLKDLFQNSCLLFYQSTNFAVSASLPCRCPGLCVRCTSVRASSVPVSPMLSLVVVTRWVKGQVQERFMELFSVFVLSLQYHVTGLNSFAGFSACTGAGKPYCCLS